MPFCPTPRKQQMNDIQGAEERRNCVSHGDRTLPLQKRADKAETPQ